MQKSETIIIIPARLGSTRLGSKPLAMIGDKTMIEHVASRAVLSGVGKVCVATDSAEIAKKAESVGAKSAIVIEAETGTDRVFQALEIMDNGRNIDFVINLQGDLPFVEPDLIKKLSEALRDSEADIITPINKEPKPESNNSSRVKVKRSGARGALDFSRDYFDDDDHFWHHIGIYGFRRDSLAKFVALPQSMREKNLSLEQLRALDNGMKIDVLEVKNDIFSVDTVEDLQLARNLYNKLHQIV